MKKLNFSIIYVRKLIFFFKTKSEAFSNSLEIKTNFLIVSG